MENKHKASEHSSFLTKHWLAIEHWGLIALFLGGIVLSVVSIMDLCTSQCTGTKSYLLLGLPFAYIGMAFFSSALLFQFLSKTYPILRTLLALMIVGSLGAEVIFIWIQKYQIGAWCPICLSIAALITLAGGFMLIGSIIQNQQAGTPMKTLKSLFNTLPMFVVGLVVALVGISKPDHNLIAMNSMKDKIILGDASSPVEVYFISDWFCPACKRAEPVITGVAPKIMDEAGLFFVDLAVHPETANFTPYNLDFLVHNKQNYFAIREELIKLSKNNRAPDDEAIIGAIKPTGENLKELSYGEIKAGLSFYDEITKKYKIRSTPTVLVVNRKTNEFRQLSGSKISEASILAAIQELKKN